MCDAELVSQLRKEVSLQVLVFKNLTRFELFRPTYSRTAMAADGK